MKMMKATYFLVLAMVAPILTNAQAFPEGPGKDLVESQCATCHGLEQVKAHRDTKDGWDALVAYMVSRGMTATNEEVTVMVEYLAKNFPPPPKPATGKSK